MPQNVNPWVAELLSWHGHDRGGVHVPFQVRTNKPVKTIETGLVKRLRSLARSIAAGDAEAPRWIFLIGVYWLLSTSVPKIDNLVYHQPSIFLCHVVLNQGGSRGISLVHERKVLLEKNVHVFAAYTQGSNVKAAF